MIDVVTGYTFLAEIFLWQDEGKKGIVAHSPYFHSQAPPEIQHPEKSSCYAPLFGFASFQNWDLKTDAQHGWPLSFRMLNYILKLHPIEYLFY